MYPRRRLQCLEAIKGADAVAKLEDILNRLVEAGTIAVPGTESQRLARAVSGESFVSFPTEWGAVLFEREGFTALQTGLADLLAYKKELADTLDLKDMQERVMDFLGDRFVTRAKVDRTKASAFVTGILQEPVEIYTVYRELFGVAMGDKTKRVDLGPFAVMHYPSQRADIIDMNRRLHKYEQGHEFEFAICVSVSARTTARAQARADELFAQFEFFMRFFMGPFPHIEVGVLNYRGRATLRSMTFKDDGIVNVLQSNVGSHQPFPIDHSALGDEKHAKIWALLKVGKRLNPLEERVLRAVEWIGEASQEASIQSGFLKAAIALELLLVNKDSSHISPSITARLSETVALLLGSTPEKRAELERLTKKLYGIRSAVAHSGASSVGWEDLSHLLNIGRAAVHTLLGDEDLSTLQSIDEVLALLTRRKYSFVGFKESGL